MEIIVKNYQHFNRSIPGWTHPTKGRWINSKKEYDDLCDRHGLVPYEKAEEIAEKARAAKIKPYKVSEQSLAIINSAKQSADRKGRVKLGDRAIAALIEKKAIGRVIPEYMRLPSSYLSKGGFQ